MSAPRWQQLEALFEQGIELASDARATWLAGLDIDADLRKELVAMLAADEATTGTRGLTGRLGAAVGDAVDLPLAGQRLGPYRLVSELGAGGMGLVFLAERADEQFRQQVAIKLIRGFASSAAAEQLRHERQLLAELDHPNIARLLDGGETVQGQPYLVMEYVRGEPIAAAARARNLPLDARLRLVRDLARAVHYAHQRLIVHRDIKPANVLLRDDGRPVLLDFGIAKLVDPSNLGSGLTQQWFTPAYASPEQRRGLPVSTATDVHALGLLLFELLTDSTPEPDAHGELRAPSQVAPPGRRRAVRGDLDRIVARATAVEPQARYASAEALAQDIERHLEGRPILASPDRFGYRFGKFLRRHPLGMGAATVGVLLLAVFAWRLADERDRALQAEINAQAESVAAASVTEFLVELFGEADPDKGQTAAALSPVELIDRGRARLAERSDVPDAQRGRLLGTLGSIYANLGHPEKATETLDAAVEAARRGGMDATQLAGLLNALAGARDLRGDYDGAVSASLEALALVRWESDADALQVVKALQSVGMMRIRAGDYENALSSLQEARALSVQVSGEDSVETAQVDVSLAENAAYMGEFERAFEIAEPAVARLRAELPPSSADLWPALMVQASIYRRTSRYDEAERVLHEVLQQRTALLQEDSTLVANVHSELGSVYYDQGRTREAAEQFLHTLEVNQRLLAPDDASLAIDYNNVASLYEEIGDYEGAEPMMRKALAIVERSVDDHQQEVVIYRQNLGRLLMLRGQAEEARHYIELPVPESEAEALRRMRARQALQRADWARRFGDAEESQRWLDHTESVIDDIGGREGGAYGALLRHRGLLAWRLGDLDTARERLEAAHAHWAGVFGERFIGCGEIALELAEVEAQAGRPAQARRHLDEAVSILDPLLVPHAPQRAQIAALQRNLAAEGS